MIQSHSEDKIRKLLSIVGSPLAVALVETKNRMDHWEGKHESLNRDYANTVESMRLLLEIFKELGHKEPEKLPNDKLEQIKLFK